MSSIGSEEAVTWRCEERDWPPRLHYHFPSLRIIQSLLHSSVRLINYFIRHRWLSRWSNVFLSTPKRILWSYDSLPSSAPLMFVVLQAAFDGTQTESLISLKIDEYLLRFADPSVRAV